MARVKTYDPFQSTLPRGSDRKHTFKFAECVISIHAPSRERQYSRLKNNLTELFQSTLPRGSDTSSGFFFCPEVDFNPRSLAGATWSINLITCRKIFQSTLPRGSDHIMLFIIMYGSISIHAPSRERHTCLLITQGVAYFNPRSLAGATLPET